MLYSCYLRQGIVYVPTVGKRGGVYTMIEPVAVVPVTNVEGLRCALLDAIARKNVAVPPVKGTWPPPLLPKYAGVKSSAAFVRGTLTWNIQENNGLYQIVGHRLHQDGYWVEGHAQILTMCMSRGAGQPCRLAVAAWPKSRSASRNRYCPPPRRAGSARRPYTAPPGISDRRVWANDSASICPALASPETP